MVQTRSAENTARRLLHDVLPRRWAHVQQVAARAERMTAALDERDGELLTATAWLHDVGYAPDLVNTAFHHLDGARFLRRQGVPERIVGLVAFHSAAAAEAEALDLADHMLEFSDERSLIRDLLWYADMTTGPGGDYLTFDQRMAEVRERYPHDHYVVRALDTGMDERVAAIARAEGWLRDVGLAGHV